MPVGTGNFVHHVHAFHHFAKHRVAEVTLAVIQKALSATFRKNWLVALSLSAVRAIEMVPRRLRKPLSASFLIGALVDFAACQR